MGKWLAEYQENTLETGIYTTDSTDTSHDLSVLSVPNRGVLTETNNVANIANEVLVLIEQSCEGFEITPNQFMGLTTKEDRELILSGELPIKVLKTYAKSFADGIQIGRITFHPTFNHGIPSGKQAEEEYCINKQRE